MAPILYKMVSSPPAVSILQMADYLGIELDGRDISIPKGENKTPEYLKKNPMGTIPMLEDGNFIVAESHAILRYLLAKYSDNKTLYPEDIEARAIVDQVSFYNAAVFFPRLEVAINYYLTKKQPPPEVFQKIDAAFGVLEAYLTNRKFIAADHLTIADFSIASTAFFMKPLYTLDAKKHPRTAAWLANLEKQPYFSKYSEPGLPVLKKILGL